MSKLKNCPFCGSDEAFLSVVKHTNKVYAVLCCECGGKGGTCESRKEAENAWNRREQLAEAAE